MKRKFYFMNLEIVLYNNIYKFLNKMLITINNKV